MANQLTALCAVASFLWLANSLEDHQIIEQPRLSSLLVLLIASVSSYVVSFFAVWLPGANGRFDDELGPLKLARANLPKKPRRYFLPLLVICIILRLEAFHRVTFDLQCSKPGVQACLPLVIVLYELLPGRRMRLRTAEEQIDKDYDDFGMTVFDALGAWIHESGALVLAGVAMLTLGTYLVASRDLPSTFFCAGPDRSVLVLSLQWAGLVLDATIIIVAWRILAWARTTKSRLRTLSGVLLIASLGVGLAYWTSHRVLHPRLSSYHFRSLDSLYVFDVVVDGLAFSAFLVATSLLATEGSPLSQVGIITFSLGLVLAVQKTRLVGTWENISPGGTYFALMCICLGFSLFVYVNNIRSVVFMHRAFVVFLLVLLTTAATIYTPIKAFRVIDNHPLMEIIYDARTEADRWLRHATVSDSLPVAVQEYQERHGGRTPPPKFDIWYEFAKERRSEILDHFPQIEHDLLPFWGVPPSKIKEDVRRAAALPDMAMLRFQGGMAQHNLPATSPYKPVMDGMLDLVKAFAKHLPDMELTINLDERPRILAPWADVQRLRQTASRKRVSRLLPRDSPSINGMPEAQPAVSDNSAVSQNFTSVRALREMTALACPPGTKARAATHWDIRDFCDACAKPQSQGPYLINWPLSQDICHQSDLLRLHSFHMTSPQLRPLQELLPVFSRAKTDSYSDILLPLRRISEPPEPPTDAFDMKYKQLFWRGKVDRPVSSHELVRGGHQERLVHTLNTAARSERTRLLLPNRDKWAFEQVPTAQLNSLLPIDVAFTSYTACKASGGGGGCDAATKEFSTKPEDAEPLRNQYVLVVDSDNGPPREFLRTLRSGSVPFYGSVFREWFTERLRPWTHFVPVDLRFHALHGTLAYFRGIQDGVKETDLRQLNGREVVMPGRGDDAEWIAEQGQRWAEKALRREDMEVYLFRLLLEWGRVVDDKRDEIGFVSR